MSGRGRRRRRGAQAASSVHDRGGKTEINEDAASSYLGLDTDYLTSLKVAQLGLMATDGDACAGLLWVDARGRLPVLPARHAVHHSAGGQHGSRINCFFVRLYVSLAFCRKETTASVGAGALVYIVEVINYLAVEIFEG